MERAELEAHLSGFRGAGSSYPFGPEALVYKVRGKMFALVSGEGETATVTLKCAPRTANFSRGSSLPSNRATT